MLAKVDFVENHKTTPETCQRNILSMSQIAVNTADQTSSTKFGHHVFLLLPIWPTTLPLMKFNVCFDR